MSSLHDPLDIRLLKEVETRITDDIQQTYANFGLGGWINRNDASATGMQAVMIQCRIEGLRVALLHLRQGHDALTGKTPKKKDAA